MNIAKTFLFLKQTLSDPTSYFNNTLTPYEKGMIAKSKYPSKQYEEMSIWEQEEARRRAERKKEELLYQQRLKELYDNYIYPIKQDLMKFKAKSLKLLEFVKEKIEERKQIDYRADLNKGMKKVYQDIEKTGNKQINKVKLMTTRFIRMKNRINRRLNFKFRKIKRFKGFQIRFNKFKKNTQNKVNKILTKYNSNYEKIHYITGLCLPEQYSIKYEPKAMFDIKKLSLRRLKIERLLMQIEDYDQILAIDNKRRREQLEKENELLKSPKVSSVNSSIIYEKFKTIKRKGRPSIILPGQIVSPLRIQNSLKNENISEDSERNDFSDENEDED